jgi:RNA polymerase sigma-70 factor (ECF subfamily)
MEANSREANSRQLVEAARAGDRRAVEGLLARHLSSLRAFVRLNSGRRLREREAQSDLVQTVCREILERASDFEYRDEPSFRAWLYQTARRKIIDRARFWKSEKRTPSREVPFDARRNSASGAAAPALPPLSACYATFCTPSREAMVHEEEARIEAAFAKLPPDHRKVITLARLAGLPHKEIAAQMNRNENAVRQLLFRALANLAVQLDRAPEGRAGDRS